MTHKSFRERYFVPLKRMFGARKVHDVNVHQIFSAMKHTFSMLSLFEEHLHFTMKLGTKQQQHLNSLFRNSIV